MSRQSGKQNLEQLKSININNLKESVWNYKIKETMKWGRSYGFCSITCWVFVLRNDFLYILTTRGRINNIFVAIWLPHIINFERIIIFVWRLYAFLPRMQVNGLIAIYNLQIIETFMHIHTHLHTITVKNKLIWQLKHHQDTWPR